jgi:hypothetical protein
MWWITENMNQEFNLSCSVHEVSKVWLLTGQAACVYLSKLTSLLNLPAADIFLY